MQNTILYLSSGCIPLNFSLRIQTPSWRIQIFSYTFPYLYKERERERPFHFNGLTCVCVCVGLVTKVLLLYIIPVYATKKLKKYVKFVKRKWVLNHFLFFILILGLVLNLLIKKSYTRTYGLKWFIDHLKQSSSLNK